MNLAAENIFALSQPDCYDCFVERYHSSFQVIRIRIERFSSMPLPAQNLMELVFTGVLYFEGALTWTGANFCIAAREACYETLYRAQILTDDTDEDEVQETLDTYHLFLIRTASGFDAKLVANAEDYAVNIIR
jgi:hypothetical protein